MAAKNIFNFIPEAFKFVVGAGLWDTFKELLNKWIRSRLDPTRRQAFFRAYITNMIQGNLKRMYDEACTGNLKLPDGTVPLEDNFVDLFTEFSAEDLMLASVTMDMMPYDEAVKSLGVMYNNPLQQRVIHIHRMAKKHLAKAQKTIAKASVKAWLKAITFTNDRRNIADGWNKRLVASAKREKKRVSETTDDDHNIARLKKQLQTERKKGW